MTTTKTTVKMTSATMTTKDTAMKREAPSQNLRKANMTIVKATTREKKEVLTNDLGRSEWKGKHLLERNIRSHITNTHKLNMSGRNNPTCCTRCTSRFCLPLNLL